MDIDYWKEKLDAEIDEIRVKLQSISGSKHDDDDAMGLKDVKDQLIKTKNTSLSSLKYEVRIIHDKNQRMIHQNEYNEYETSILNMIEKVNEMSIVSERKKDEEDDTDPIKAGDRILLETEHLQTKTQSSLSKTRDMINEAKDVGMTTVHRLKDQRDQLQNVQDTVISTEEKLQKSDKLMKKFWRGSSRVKVKKEDEHQYNKVSGIMTQTGTSPLKVGSQFKELQTSIIDRIQNIHSFLEEERQYNSGSSISVAGGNNPKSAAIRHSKLRMDLQRASDEFEEMNNLYLLEMKKKRSRYSAEELGDQKRVLDKLSLQLNKIKEMQNGRFGVAVSVDVGQDSTSRDSPRAELTDEQSDRLKKINQKDQEFNRQLDDIGEGISDLLDIAEMQNLEVDAQNQRLQTLETDTANMQHHMTHVNAKMKRALMRITGKRS
jgi:hypothetical protein